jgi:HAE1 family hydrophobic/amphiphilic exporter-1
MMTTLAMIFGMVPLALAIGQGAEMRAPMARAVIGGLITSTLLTLIVVPVVYTVLDDFAAWIHRRWLGANALEKDAQAATATTVVSSLIIAALLTATTVSGDPMPTPSTSATVAVAIGQPATPESSVVLTLEDAVRVVQERNRDVEKARAYEQWVQGRYVEERSAALPKLEASAYGMRSWDGSMKAIFGDLFPAGQTTGVTDLKLKQALFTWGQVGAAIRAAKSGIAAADDQTNATRQAAIRDVTSAFYSVLLAEKLETIAKENLLQRERHLRQAERQFELGTATDFDVLAARVAVDNAKPPVFRTASAIILAKERLRLLLAEERPELQVTGSLDAEVKEPPAVEEVLETAFEKRPDLQSLVHSISVYREFVKIQGAGNKPRLDLEANAGWKWFDAGPMLADDGKTWNLGVFMTFPFFDGLKTKGKVIQAKSDLTRAELDLAQARDSVRLEVRTAVDAVKENAEIVKALSGTVAQARRLLEMAEKGFEYGVKTRLEVEDAQLSVTQAEGNLAIAKRDYLVARVTLEYVKGAL